MTSMRGRVANAAVTYTALVFAAGFAFQLLNTVLQEPPWRYARILFGPASSLFSHLSVYLFAFQSVFVFPWLLVDVANERARMLGAVGFLISWLVVGWFMYDVL